MGEVMNQHYGAVCAQCGHRWEQHTRHASGSEPCRYFGCGCGDFELNEPRAFQHGDRVRFNERGRVHARHPFRLGVYLSLTRDGFGDRVQWDGRKKAAVINRGFLELVPTEPEEGA